MTTHSNPVSVRPTTDGDRAEALRTGIPALQQLVDKLADDLDALRDLLRLSRGLADHPRIQERDRAAWKRGWSILTNRADALDELVDQAAAVGVASGDRILAAGGDFGRADDFYGWPCGAVAKEIEKHGRFGAP